MPSRAAWMAALLAVVVVLGVAGVLGLGGHLGGDSSEQQADVPQPERPAGQPEQGHVERIVYPKDGVVCWVYDHQAGYRGAGGISCLPLNETSVNASG